MRCDEVEERLSAFQDDELDPVTSRQVEEHVETCAACADSLARIRALSDGLRAEVPYHAAPERLRDRVSRAAWAEAGRTRTRRTSGTPGRAWLGAAAMIAVIVTGVLLFGSVQRERGLASIEGEVVSSHVRSLMASHLTDIASTDQHTVKPWFNGRLDFSPVVTDLAASGYPLIGGRLDYLGGRPVAALIYQRRKHWINVFSWPDEGKVSSNAPASRQGYHVIHATRGGMSYWIVSDLNEAELSEFARLLLPAGPR